MPPTVVMLLGFFLSASLKAAINCFDRQFIYQMSREGELFKSSGHLFAAWLVKVVTDTTTKWWSYLSVSVLLLQLELS